jgi:hypothetical protein
LNGEKTEQLIVEHQIVDAALQEVHQTFYQAQQNLLPILDTLFGDLGILPDERNIAVPPPVPVVEAEVVAEYAQHEPDGGHVNASSIVEGPNTIEITWDDANGGDPQDPNPSQEHLRIDQLIQRVGEA